MDQDWVNRVGILLNFLAGFMIAPELIGIDRLKRIEGYIEEKLLRLSNSFVQQFDYLRSKIRDAKSNFSGSLGCVLVSLVPISILVGILLLYHRYLIAICVLILYFMAFTLGVWIMRWGVASQVQEHNEYIYRTTGEGTPPENYPKQTIRLEPLISLRLLLWIPAEFLRLIMIIFFGVLAIIPLRGINKIISFFVRMLDGQERLRAIMVSTGVIIYILGNALQFISTF
jgi:hypothetical protein